MLKEYSLRKEEKWISIESIPPKVGEYYIVYCKEWIKYGCEQGIFMWDGEHWSYDNQTANGIVTHYQPLHKF